jgi:hypothetical protein
MWLILTLLLFNVCYIFRNKMIVTYRYIVSVNIRKAYGDVEVQLHSLVLHWLETKGRIRAPTVSPTCTRKCPIFAELEAARVQSPSGRLLPLPTILSLLLNCQDRNLRNTLTARTLTTIPGVIKLHNHRNDTTNCAVDLFSIH